MTGTFYDRSVGDGPFQPRTVSDAHLLEMQGKGTNLT